MDKRSVEPIGGLERHIYRQGGIMVASGTVRQWPTRPAAVLKSAKQGKLL